ncbi:hypothetical protein [Clostridium sp.]|jgi:hypothetical protein|uniref:hypothetical protein n=1 Tax=Clostridium sp. TaxID=1506 RepID=UPI002584AFCE|nr:hypothetical protein [Clostridium sp.]MDF2503072.1 hypothetical protein [Clostridium sp.]
MKQTRYNNLRFFEMAINTALEKSNSIIIKNELYSTYLKIEYVDKNGNNYTNKIYYKKNDDNTVTVIIYKKELKTKDYFIEYFKQKINEYKGTCTSLIILEYKPLTENFVKTAVISNEENIKEILEEINYEEIIKINPGKSEINIHINSEYFNILVSNKRIC